MDIFHAEKPFRGKQYTLVDVLKDPLKPAFREIFQDLNYESLFKGGKKRKSNLNDIVVLASFGISSVPHELMHAGVNLLTGGQNEEIVINRFYGGDLVHQIYSGIDAQFLLPIIGGYVKVKEYGSKLGELAMTVAPYALTPLGIYMVAEGKKRKSLALAAAGSGMLLAHAGGMIGDFFTFGQTVLYDAANLVANTLGYEKINSRNFLVSLPFIIGGFYIGSKTTSFTYRAFKGGINSLRNRLGGNNQYTGLEKSVV